MKITKLLIMALCVFTMILSLASCGDDDIGSYLDHYDWQEEEIEKVTLDLYIVVGEGTTENAMTTVRDKINQHLDDKYYTKLNIHYIAESEYDAEIKRITADGSTSNTGIVLINSKEMMDDLMSKDALVDVLGYLGTKDFGKLNTQIAPALLNAAVEKNASGADAMYCVPNNHVIGNYEYVVINKAIAKDMLNYTLTELEAMTTWESTEALRNDVTTYAAQLGENITVDDVVTVKTGNYELRNQYTLEKGYVCNVARLPQTTKEEVYSSAFGILADTENKDRAMQIIYAINTDTELRNYLQYGVEHTNYTIVNGLVVPTSEADSIYNMNLVYTGDVFKALYSEAEGFTKWNQEIFDNGKLQNNDAVVYQEPVVPDEGTGDDTTEGDTENGGSEGSEDAGDGTGSGESGSGESGSGTETEN